MTKSGHADGSETQVVREPSGRVTAVATPWWRNELTHIGTTGQVKTLTRGPQRLEWTYDGFLMKEEKASGVAPGTSQWSYDSDFRVSAHTVGGTQVAFGYDGDSLLTSVGAATLTRLPATGQLASLVVGTVTTDVTHNPYGELATVTTRSGATELYSEGLSYDVAGRLTVVEEVVEGVPAQWVYGYEALGRLTSAAKNGGAPTTWSYDGNGNRLTEDGVASTFDAQDRLLTKGATTYAWDGLGGRLTKTEGAQVTRYVHDGLGALQSVALPDGTAVAYEYDGRQRRVAKKRNGVVVKRWLYDGQYRVSAEVDSTGAVTNRFVYGSQGHSPDYVVQGGATYAYMKSHLGSIKLVVNAATGVVAQRLEYDAWGNVLADSSPGFQPFGFAGGVYDADTKLTHFGYRDYDASAGVWTSKDPIRLKGGLNGYAYAAATPSMAIDPEGRTVVFSKNASPRLLRAVNRLLKTSRGRFLWGLLEESTTVFVIGESGLGWTRGYPDRGICGGQGRESGTGRKATIDLDLDFKHQDMHNRFNPPEADEFLLAHELGHALDFLGGLPGDAGSEDAADWVAAWATGGSE